jgi:hypothetical protein
LHHKQGLLTKKVPLERKLKLDEASASTLQQKEKIRTTSKQAKELAKINVELQLFNEKEIKLGQLSNSNERPFFLWNLFFKEVFDDGGFDIVIGNPPYVSAVNMARNENEKKVFKDKYPLATGSYDLYLLFLLLAIEISNKKGVYSWIIPNKFLISDYSKKTLDFLKESCGLALSLNVSDFEVFKGVSVYPIIIRGVIHKQSQFNERFLEKYSDLISRNFKEQFSFPTFPTIGSNSILINSGATGFQAQQIRPFVQNGHTENSIPFIVSGSVDRYLWDNSDVRYMKSRFYNAHIVNNEFVANSKWNFWNSPKIVIAGMTKIIEAVYVETPLALGVGIYGIYDFGGYEPYSLTAILNSSYLTHFFKIKFKDKHLAGGYLAINKGTIEEFPIPILPKKTENKLSELSLKLHKEILTDIQRNEIENEIDIIVFNLFNVDYQDAIKINEGISINEEDFKNLYKYN